MCKVFTTESIREMISHRHNAFQCNVMHANQGPVYAFSSKIHVQTARESHDLKMDFEASKQLRVTNSHEECGITQLKQCNNLQLLHQYCSQKSTWSLYCVMWLITIGAGDLTPSEVLGLNKYQCNNLQLLHQYRSKQSSWHPVPLL